MNHHTSSRQRRSANSNDNMKKLQSDRSCNTHSMHAFHLFSSLDKHTHKCDQYLTNLFMGLNNQLLQGLAIISESLVDLQVLVGILVEIPLLDTTTQVVVVKVVMVTHNMLKDEVVHPMGLVACLVLVLGEELVVVVVMAWGLQITHRMVHILVVLVLVVALM